jgi:hypothetical protein
MLSLRGPLRIVETYLDEDTGKEYLRAEGFDPLDDAFFEQERRGSAGHDSSDEIPCVSPEKGWEYDLDYARWLDANDAD